MHSVRGSRLQTRDGHVHCPSTKAEKIDRNNQSNSEICIEKVVIFYYYASIAITKWFSFCIYRQLLYKNMCVCIYIYNYIYIHTDTHTHIYKYTQMLNQNSHFKDLLSTFQVMMWTWYHKSWYIWVHFQLNEKEIHPHKDISLCGIPTQTGLWP